MLVDLILFVGALESLLIKYLFKIKKKYKNNLVGKGLNKKYILINFIPKIYIYVLYIKVRG